MNPLVRIPLVKGDKQPLVMRWSVLPPDNPIWAETFASHPDCNVGLRLDQLVVIDCDSPEKVAWWLEHGPATPFRSRGREERRSFWYRRQEGSTLTTTRHGDWEVRTGPGAQCVVPPSVHPSGRRYTWDGPPVDEAHLDAVPVISDDEVTALRARLDPCRDWDDEDDDAPAAPRGTWSGPGAGTAAAVARLERACARIRSAPGGRSNAVAKDAVSSLARISAAGLIDPRTARVELLAAMGDREVGAEPGRDGDAAERARRGVLRSSWRWGWARPADPDRELTPRYEVADSPAEASERASCPDAARHPDPPGRNVTTRTTRTLGPLPARLRKVWPLPGPTTGAIPSAGRRCGVKRWTHATRGVRTRYYEGRRMCWSPTCPRFDGERARDDEAAHNAARRSAWPRIYALSAPRSRRRAVEARIKKAGGEYQGRNLGEQDFYLTSVPVAPPRGGAHPRERSTPVTPEEADLLSRAALALTPFFPAPGKARNAFYSEGIGPEANRPRPDPDTPRDETFIAEEALPTVRPPNWFHKEALLRGALTTGAEGGRPYVEFPSGSEADGAFWALLWSQGRRAAPAPRSAPPPRPRARASGGGGPTYHFDFDAGAY